MAPRTAPPPSPRRLPDLYSVMPERKILDLAPARPDASPVDLFAAALANARQRTLAALEDVTQVELDWLPSPASNSIGTLLYHIALIEADWLYAEILEQPYPDAVLRRFPWGDRDASGRLTPIVGAPLDEHVERLAWVRQELERALEGMTEAEFRRRRHLPAYEVSPVFVAHHLLQHEAQHRGEIVVVRRLAQAAERSA